ncbi:MAG: Fur-regulated basic protein FbpA [Bacillota bacterium]|nr:Fur-regulated basic protein FbpA [Bacillota bacterium]
MSRLSEVVENRKAKLIEVLINHNVFKTTDQRHLYDVPLNILESEYKLLRKKEEKA